jgi:hypothetical protein
MFTPLEGEHRLPLLHVVAESDAIWRKVLDTLLTLAVAGYSR